MGSEGIQITIPDFDDDDFGSTPVFGRSQAGGLWGNSSGQESPTVLTPIAQPERSEKGYFHSRGDSVASEDSAHSIQYTTRKPKAPFVHSAQSSVATTGSSPFTRKTSFASLRNAFKSKPSEPAPPVPSLDHHAYPALKNPFNRSTSSLAQVPPLPPSGRVTHVSPPQLRPVTPASGDSKVRGTPVRSKSHAYGKSQHSHSESVFHSSDGGSDHGHGFPYLLSSSPPPVPRVPGVSSVSLSDSEDKITMDPRTPSDYALHAIFIRFAASAESHIEAFLRKPLDREPLLTDLIGPGVDANFDDLLLSLGKIAQKHAKPVIDSVMRWRKSQNDSVSAELVRQQAAQSGMVRGARAQDVLNERKSLASIYIMCRTLIAATESISKDGLGEALGHSLEELTFEQFRKPDMKMLTQSVNHRSNADLYAKLLGHLADVRFESVTDRFLTELGPVAAGLVPKDADFKYENLLRGLQHIQIKVWPPEKFEEGAEFFASLSKSFENAHGNRLKTTFAETLVQILHPIAKTAQAEVNHPDWAKAMEVIYPRARDMMSKPRYWHVAYPLAVTALCVAPHELFLRHWNACLEAGLNKLKEKPYRIPVMNGMIRLIWTYLYRCHESASTATTKLESILKHFFPANRLTISPSDDHVEPFIYIVHFVLSRHFDFGSDLCLELLQERSVTSQSAAQYGLTLAPERMAIAIQAILLSLHVVEREEPTPAWPSGPDFSELPSKSDYPSSADPVPAALLSKLGWKDLIDRASLCVKLIVTPCFNSVGKWSIFDDQWSAKRLNPAYEETHSFVIRRHAEGDVAYPAQTLPQINVLQLIYQSWPRLLHSSLPLDDVFDMLLQGVVHVEPALGEAASSALQRFMADPSYASALLARFSAFLFSPQTMFSEGASMKLNVESGRLLNLWTHFVDLWASGIKQRPRETLTAEEVDAIVARSEEIEAGALFLLAHCRRAVFATGVKAFRILHGLGTYVETDPPSPNTGVPDVALRIVDALHGKIPSYVYIHGHEDFLDPGQLARLDQWKESAHADALLRLADSDKAEDRVLWRHIFPAFLHSCVEHSPTALPLFRDKVATAVTHYHQLMLQLSGVSVRTPVGIPQRSGSLGENTAFKLVNDNIHLIQQWHLWIKIVCATAQVSEVRPTVNYPLRDHSRARSEVMLDRDQMTTTRDLFKYLSQFLDSDHGVFRDTAVSCIRSFPPYSYSYLLEDLSTLAARNFYDDSRSKSISGPVIGRARRQERFHTAVARIYFVTAHSLREQRSLGKQTALSHVLKYVRNVQAFLTTPDHRDLFSLQRLRRYFCGTVERLFDGLATLKDSDRFIPPNMHLALYRLCEDWCQLGKQSESATIRLVHMQAAAGKSFSDPSDQAELIQRFQTETKSLSHAAVGAMAALCHKAFFPPEVSSASPTDRQTTDAPKPLRAAPTLDRLTAFLASFHESTQGYGKKALRALLAHTPSDHGFLDEVLIRAFVVTRDMDNSNARFFEIVADVICNSPMHGFSFSQVVCLGLSNLCHSALEIRRRAFDILEIIHEQSAGLLSLVQYETSVGSSAPSAFLHAHKLISDVLAGEHPEQAVNVLTQFSGWIPRVFDSRSERDPLLLLQSLEYWVPNIDLMEEDKSGLSREGRCALCHLMSLTSRYAESHAEQVLVLWTRLMDLPYQSNGHATIRFLLEQSHKVGSTGFISCAAKVVACLSQSAVGRQIFEELCSVIEPARMLPTLEHKLTIPDAEDIELWSDLDVLFSEQPRLSLGVAQFAFLFLSASSWDRYWELQTQLPVLLHALFMHLDHRQPFIQQQARHMLFQIMRSCMAGYDENPDRSLQHTRAELKSTIAILEHDTEERLWKEDDTSERAEAKMRWFMSEVLNLLEPLHPNLRRDWGALALTWGTACSIRPIAFRSLQLYRALASPVSQFNLGTLLGRMSNTIAEDDTSIQDFTVEILSTLTSMTSSSDLDVTLLPQLFWGAVASLSTTVENEFRHVLEFLETVLTRLDLDDPLTAEHLLSHRPTSWDGDTSLQSSLLTGLRSSATSGFTFKLLQRLTKVVDPRLIDPSERRVRDLYTLSLPWCLHAMVTDSQDEALQEFALNIGRLAEEEERPTISRIMTSFAKARFRTKDDFLRQSVATLREHYGAEDWTDVITLLMGLVLNKERWLRIHTMQILKVLFQQRETRNPVDLLGSELLMPLLRLLETDLASQALDVLDEPMQISGGPAAKHVLRMSLYTHLRADAKEVESVAEVFGIAQESGWCIPHSTSLRLSCRANISAVFGLCKVNTRPSRIDFQPEDALALTTQGEMDDDLGDMVQNLHELSSFFQEDRPAVPVPNKQLEARVAAILAKSTDPMTDVPQTPFVDVFDIGSLASYEDSDDSDSDTGSDLFEFDSPSAVRYMSKDSRFH